MAWCFRVTCLLLLSLATMSVRAADTVPMPWYDIQTDLQLAKLEKVDAALAKQAQLRIEQLSAKGGDPYAILTAYNHQELVNQLMLLANDFRDDPENRDLRVQREAYLEGDWNTIDIKVPALRLMGQQHSQLQQVMTKTKQRTIQAPRDTGNWLLYARLMANSNDFAEAMVGLKWAVLQFQQKVSEFPDEPIWQYWLAMSYQYAGVLELRQQQLSAASRDLQASAALINNQARRDPSSELWQHALLQSYSYLAALQLAQQDAPTAEATLKQALALVERQKTVTASSARWQQNLAVINQQLARVGQVASRPVSSLNVAPPAVAEKLPAPVSQSNEQQLSAQLNQQIEHYRQQQQWQQALPLAQQRVVLLDKLATANAFAESQLQSAWAWGQFAQLQLASRNIDGAINSLNQQRERLQRLYQQQPTEVGYQYQLAQSLADLGQAYAQKGKNSQARAWYRQSQALVDKISQASPNHEGGQRLAQSLQQRVKALSR